MYMSREKSVKNKKEVKIKMCLNIPVCNVLLKEIHPLKKMCALCAYAHKYV